MFQTSRRQFLASGVAAGIHLAAANPSRAVASPANEAVRLGFISCGGRANELMRAFTKVDGVTVNALCDPDESRLGKAKQRFSDAAGYADLRQLLDSDNVDAVVVATCNHWHCLASIWAMEAGKDVYVEKPLSHSQWEGAQTVAAARKYGRVCQLGTQQRSDPMQAEIKEFLHGDAAIGKLESVRVNRFGVRGPIGRRSTPLEIAANVDYNLWLGPAQDKPIFRNKLQYDWHWDWNTGSGEMGNWGVHVLDDVRNVVFQDQVALPKRILGGGGRLVWDDAGETPNVHIAWFDTGIAPVVIGLSNLTAGPEAKGSPKHPGPGSGYIAYCEGGRLEGQRGRAVAFDSEGKQIRQFRGTSGMGRHQQNFIEAVRSRRVEDLNADVETGNHSTGWCNLANVAFQAGDRFSHEALQAVDGESWQALVREMHDHLIAHRVNPQDPGLKVSGVLELDPETGRFRGDSEAANRWLRREYREGFVVPELV
ncbi:MAG: Gfo/Idh/MocA family protein [Planctomycetaceae bacterium]